MKTPLKTKILLLRTDFLSAFSKRKPEILGYIIVTILGIAFGVWLGRKIGEAETPFGAFASLFRLSYDPFSYLLPELLRFSIFSLIASLSHYLPFAFVYPVFSLFFFGKHFGEYVYLTFCVDPLLCALPSALLTLLPLLMIGSALLVRIVLLARDLRLCNGGFPCRESLKRTGWCLLLALTIYALALFSVYLVLCGSIYLLLLVL